MHIRLVCLALSLATAAGCGDGASATTDAAPTPPPAVLNGSAVSARERLQLASSRFVEPASYSYTARESCYCTGPDSLRISVVNGQVSNVLGKESFSNSFSAVSDEVRAKAKTLPGLTAALAMEIGDEPRYDDTRFYVDLDPALSFVIGYSAYVDVADGSYELHIGDFTTPADAP